MILIEKMSITSLITFTIFLSINLCLILGAKYSNNDGSKNMNHQRLEEREKRFLFYKSNAINERPCTCTTQQSCNCCEDVTLLLIKAQRRLCANLMYQRNGLNIDISLDSNTVRSMTVTVYRPLKICTLIPGSLFSGVCLNLIELNAFPRSLTICPRFQITTKDQEWRINYTCVSISTELPMANGTSMTAMPNRTTTGVPMNQMIIALPTTPLPPRITTTAGSPSRPPVSPGMPGMTAGGQMQQTSGSARPPAMPGMTAGGQMQQTSGSARPPAMTGMPAGGQMQQSSTSSRPPGIPGMTGGGQMQPSGSPPPNSGQLRLQRYGAEDRTKYFPSRHPPVYGVNFLYNFTATNS